MCAADTRHAVQWGGEHGGGDGVAAVKYYDVADHVLQLADVTGPVVAAENVFAVGFESGEGFMFFCRVLVKEVIGDFDDIVITFPQGRQVYR